MFSATAEYIAIILLASDPQWWPRGELQHNVAPSRSCFVPDYGMQTQSSQGKVLRALDEHLMLTKNLQHHLGPL